MKTQFFRFTFYVIIVCLTGSAFNPTVAASQSSVGKLGVGEPRTVRVTHFLPSDRPYRAEMVQEIKDTLRTVQTFYADQMEAHGYGRLTFRFETDPQGEPMVHRVDGAQPQSFYGGQSKTEFFGGGNTQKNIYLAFIDSDQYRRAAWGMTSGKEGGTASAFVTRNWEIVAHELGHAFGLQHDFRDDTYIMSYGAMPNRLSSCHARYLSVHPYFNPDVPIKKDRGPTIELISPRIYPEGSRSVPVQFKLNDSDGLHQVLLFVRYPSLLSTAVDSLEVKACRSLDRAIACEILEERSQNGS